MIASLEKNLCYSFFSSKLLEAALTHPSCFSGKHRYKKDIQEFERLEFVGDRVLALVMSSWLFEFYPTAQEGELSKRLSVLVRKDMLAIVAKEMGIDKALKTKRLNGENSTSQFQTFLADACEAVLAAVFLDGGLQAAKKIIQMFWKDRISSSAFESIDSKSALQEISQKQFKVLPRYDVQSQTGSAHAPTFVLRCTVGEYSLTAEGPNRKIAENECARRMIDLIQKGKR